MKKLLLILICLVSPIALLYAQTNLPSGLPSVEYKIIESSINEVRVRVGELRTQVEQYKKGGISLSQKIQLLSKIIDAKQSIIDLRMKINAMRNVPVAVSEGVVLNTASISLGALPDAMYRGETYTITWSSSGVDTVGITIEDEKGGLGSLFNISNYVTVPASQGSFVWTVPNYLPNGDYKITIAGRYGAPVAVSPVITIMQKTEPGQAVVLMNPNGGSQHIEQDSVYPVTWSTGRSDGQITLQVKNESGTITTIGTHANKVSSKNTFNWSVPAGFAPGKYKLMLVVTDTGVVADESDNWFNIVTPLERISYITPTSGTVGTEVSIVGSYFASTNNEVFVGYPSGGTATYRLPSSDGRNIKLQIPTTYTVKGRISITVGFSDPVYFTVEEPKGAIDTVPTVTTYTPGQVYTFVWIGPELKDVVIVIKKGTKEVKIINAGTVTEGMKYDWRIPHNYYGDYTVEAFSGTNRANKVLLANEVFTVHAPTSTPSPTTTSSAFKKVGDEQRATILDAIHNFFDKLGGL